MILTKAILSEKQSIFYVKLFWNFNKNAHESGKIHILKLNMQQFLEPQTPGLQSAIASGAHLRFQNPGLQTNVPTNWAKRTNNIVSFSY